MPVKMTAAQYRALASSAGVTARTGRAPAPARRSRGGDRRPAPVQPAECFDCGERCDGETAQARHLADTGHCRYQLVLVLE